MSNSAPIGSPQQPLSEADLHLLMRALAKKQTLTEHMVIAARSNRWHLALSLIQKELGVEQPSGSRKLVDYVLHGLHRDVPDGTDAGSTLVEDLPMPWGGETDVVVSWADSMEQLQKEVASIRSCLDALGLFNTEEQHKLQELHADHLNLGVGEVSVELDRDKHQFSAKGDLKVGKVLSLLGHVIPGLGKTEIGGTLNLRLPYKDSREKFVAALMALQWQSNGALPECNKLRMARQDWTSDSLDAEELQRQWEQEVLPAKIFLQKSLQAIDREMRPAFTVHPVGERDEMYYDFCLKGMASGDYKRSIELLSRIQHSGLPVQQAMGENFFLFAANVIMQAQIAWFERDLEHVLKARFGQDLRRDAESPTTPPAIPTSGPSPSCQPPASPPSTGQAHRLRRPRP